MDGKPLLAVMVLVGSLGGAMGLGMMSDVYSGVSSSSSYGDGILKGLVCYGEPTWVTEHYQFIASHFDYVDCGFEDAAAMAAVKVLRSDVEVIGYRDMVYVNPVLADYGLMDPAWFMKTAGGDYIFNSYWGAYVMDVANVSYQQHFIDWVVSNMSTVFDGVFVDDVWSDIDDYQSGFNGTVPVAKVSSWHSDVEAFLTHVHADVSGLVIANSDEFATDDYIGLVDGQMLEGFVHCPWDNSVTWDGTHLNLGAALARKSSLSGKFVWCSSGSTDDDGSILDLCYDNFVANLTGLDRCCFSFNSWLDDDGQRGYYSVMDTVV